MKLSDVLTLLKVLLCMVACCQGCTVTTLMGCSTYDVNDTLNWGASICGCLACDPGYGLQQDNYCYQCSFYVGSCN
jgi:hypothetical protein